MNLTTNTWRKDREKWARAGQEEQEIVSHDLNASFSENSETEREKDFARGTTGFEDNNPKTHKKRSNVSSWRPLKWI